MPDTIEPVPPGTLYVYNPNARPVVELPVVYGVSDGPTQGRALAAGGNLLFERICSTLENQPDELQLTGPSARYEQYYPGGYRTEFTP